MADPDRSAETADWRQEAGTIEYRADDDTPQVSFADWPLVIYGLSMGQICVNDAILGRNGYERLSDSRRAQVRDNASSIRAELLGPGLAPLNTDDIRRLPVNER